MSQGLMQVLPGVVTDNTLPKYYPNDGWIDELTEFVFDFKKSASWPSQSAPIVGSGSASAEIFNLVPGKPNGIVQNSVQGNIGFREGGFDYVTGAAAGNGVQIGGTNDFKLVQLGNPDVLYVVWLKRETGFSTSNYQNIIGRGQNTSNYEFYMNLGVGGDDLATFFKGTTSASNGIVEGSATQTSWAELLNTTVQVGMALEGNKVKLFINGALISTGSNTLTKPFVDPGAFAISVGCGVSGPLFKGIIKRVGMTRLSSTKTAAARAAQDWNANRQRLASV